MKNNIKAIRKQRGLTQVELAKRLDISQAAIQRIENSENVQQKTLEKIARALGVHYLQLINMDAFTSSSDAIQLKPDDIDYLNELAFPMLAAIGCNVVGRDVDGSYYIEYQLGEYKITRDQLAKLIGSTTDYLAFNLEKLLKDLINGTK